MNSEQNPDLSRRDRRKFLGMMGAAFGAGALTASSVPARADSPFSSMEGVIDVRKFGAAGNGKVGDGRAIQAAIDYAGKSSGGVIWFPPGMYLLDVPLRVSQQVILAGAGWGTPGPVPSPGSILYVEDTSFVPLTLAGRGATMRDIAIYHKQPAPAAGWRPAPYKTAILVNADDVRLENIFLYNPTIGITSQNIGRLTATRIFGQPFQTGISIDNAEDVVKIDNIHFWPFWSYDPSVQDYMNKNAVAIASYRNDNPHFSNIFCFCYNTGFLFDRSDKGITSKFRIVNADNDACYVGILIKGSSTTGQVSNYTYQGPDAPLPSASAVHAAADGVVLQLSNIRLTNMRNNGVRAEGNNTNLMIDNIWIQTWDQSGKGFPAIEAADKGASVLVGFNRFFTNGTPNLSGGAGTVRLSG